MPTPDLADAVWRKSSRSNGAGNECVEVAQVLGLVGVRDSKNRAGGALTLSTDGWTGFLADVKTGAFDVR
ncbi:MAG: DUF397 domain-containing protein [Pseudonocardiaceae bacterium]|nr:DUF397 domain-containing protein [Pseudonocardiaceae bacterium]